MRTKFREHPASAGPGVATVSRRGVLKGGAAVGAASALGATVGTAGFTMFDSQAAEAAAYRATLSWKNPAKRLLRRTTYGLTRADITEINALGYNAYLERQLTGQGVDDGPLDEFIAATFPQATRNVDGWIATILNPGQDSSRFKHYDLYYAALVRSVHAKRQLFERTVEMWSDHFNVPLPLSPARYSLLQQTAIRPNALGTFPALLRAVAHSPAMLMYLSQKTNAYRPGIPAQEDFARELMELHTLGVRGGYTQNDVQEVARCFTGWQVEVGDRDPDYPRKYLEFRFRPDEHDPGPKTVLGVSIPGRPLGDAAGVQDGETVLNILANHPSTARFVATKMVRWFLGDLAEPLRGSVITQTAATYQATGGDIKAMLRVVLAQANVVAAPAKFKRPFHLVTSALRHCETNLMDTARPGYGDMLRFHADRLDTMGHQPYGWFPPNGYPDSIPFWGANLLPRYNYVLELTKHTALAGRWNGVLWPTMYPLRRVSTGEVNIEGIAGEINARFFGGEMDTTELTRIKNYLKLVRVDGSGRICELGVPFDDVNDFSWRIDGLWEAINLGLCAPAYQWY
jgi:uncharacterized protein (DUF1800 family)